MVDKQYKVLANICNLNIDYVIKNPFYWGNFGLQNVSAYHLNFMFRFQGLVSLHAVSFFHCFVSL